MSYSRKCVPIGQTVTLRAVFSDSCGEPINIDSGGSVYIYNESPSKDWADIVENSDYSEAYDSVTSVTKISDGFYEIEYTVPASAEEGTWNDLWVVEINGVEVFNVFNFNVESVGGVSLQMVNNNTLVVILLDSSIADIYGNTLGEEYQLTFSTKYNPYYCSTDLVRLEVGKWLDAVPDDTISLFIHWASIEADAITGARVRNAQMYQTARTKFVIYDVALRVLTLPVSLGGKTKRLGDLMIQNQSSFKDIIPELKKEREEWFRVVNAGGNIVPGQGLDPTFAVKGLKDPDRGRIGRGWHSTLTYPYRQPGGNVKIRKDGDIKFKTGFVDFIVNDEGRRLKEPD
jgi:hypothetical protein